MTIITAIVSPVKFGTIEIEGLMFSDGSYGVAVPQIARLFPYFQDSQNQASQKLKRLMGDGFKTHKTKTEFNRNTTLSITLLDFERVLRRLDKLSDSVAENLADDLIGLSLHQLFCDGFDIKFEADDRQKYLETRMAGKVTRSTLTDSIDSYVQTHAVSVNYGHWIYSNVSDCLNLGLFGKKASKLCIERGCNKNELRDTHDEVTLARIDKIEAVAMIQIDNGMEPIEAMKFTLSTVFRIAC